MLVGPVSKKVEGLKRNVAGAIYLDPRFPAWRIES